MLYFLVVHHGVSPESLLFSLYKHEPLDCAFRRVTETPESSHYPEYNKRYEFSKYRVQI